MAVNKVFVVGAGLMGSGISQVCAQAGIKVFAYDTDPKAANKAQKGIQWSVAKLIEKGQLEGDLSTIVKRIEFVPDLSKVSEADLVIEAVFEKLEIKTEVLLKVEGLCREETLIASNTSAIPITELAAPLKKPGRVLGLHFFSPVPMMQAVEVVKGIATTDETAEKGKDFVIQIGKEPIMVTRDVAGFVINRINFPSAIEAMHLVEQGVATVEDIDRGLRLAAGRRMGIFETGDMAGLDVTYAAMMAIYQETGDPRWYPPMILRRKVKAGHLGRKTGKGWYEYNEDGSRKE